MVLPSGIPYRRLSGGATSPCRLEETEVEPGEREAGMPPDFEPIGLNTVRP
jgi:hypothetical protein